MLTQKNLEQLWDQIDAAVYDESKVKIDTVLQRIKNMISINVNADLFYALGYTYYMHPEKTKDYNIQCLLIKSLLQAITINPKHNLAMLYLGFFSYDTEKYDEALKYFQKIAKDYLGDYFSIKTSELILCCNIRLNGLFKNLKELDKFYNTSLLFDPWDIFPIQLVPLIVDNLDICNDLFLIKKISNDLINFINLADLDFTEEVKNLKKMILVVPKIN